MRIEKIFHLKAEILAKERIDEEQKNRSDTPKIFAPMEQASSETRQETPDEFSVIETLIKIEEKLAKPKPVQVTVNTEAVQKIVKEGIATMKLLAAAKPRKVDLRFHQRAGWWDFHRYG